MSTPLQPMEDSQFNELGMTLQAVKKRTADTRHLWGADQSNVVSRMRAVYHTEQARRRGMNVTQEDLDATLKLLQ